MGLLKFFMIAVNVIFWALGGTLLGVGIWLAVDSTAFDGWDATGMDDAMWSAVVYTMIGVGAGVFVIGFLGCCGAWKKKSLMLKLYIGFVTVIIIAEVVIIILTAIFWSSINDGVEEQMQKDVQDKYLGPDENGDGITQSWNKMQYKWKCCGSFDFRDYQGSNYIGNPPISPGIYVPSTCCVYKKGYNYDDLPEGLENPFECQNEARDYTMNKDFKYLNARGCYNEMADFFEENAAIIIGVSCGVLALQILGVILAACILCSKD